MMNCSLCGSAMSEVHSQVKRVVSGKDVWFQNVPSFKCSNNICENIVIHATVVKRLREMITEIKSGERKHELIIQYPY